MDERGDFAPVDLDCQIAAAMITHRLELLGLHILRSFDLSTAACVPRPDVPCPHHGTVPCNCQLVVLLVYGEGGPPASLVAHGYDGRTWFSFVDDPSQPGDAMIQDLIRRAFEDLDVGAMTGGSMSHAT